MSDFTSSAYWQERYASGGRSGSGSYGHLAEFKAATINQFVWSHGVERVVEFGCGDGNQLGLARYPRYLGLDVAQTAVDLCRSKFSGDSTKAFEVYDPARELAAPVGCADLAISLDVIYHLVEDRVYRRYIDDLRAATTRYLIVYSTNRRSLFWRRDRHVLHRRFVPDLVADGEFEMIGYIRNPHRRRTWQHRKRSKSDFFIFERSR